MAVMIKNGVCVRWFCDFFSSSKIAHTVTSEVFVVSVKRIISLLAIGFLVGFLIGIFVK